MAPRHLRPQPRGSARRKRTDRLYVRSVGPREREALRIIEQRPGITPAQLADEMGVGLKRIWQIVGRLEYDRGVRRERT